MTPCEEAGYRVGDRFMLAGHSWLPGGTIVRLIEDNGSHQPLFETVPAHDVVGMKVYISLPLVSPKTDCSGPDFVDTVTVTAAVTTPDDPDAFTWRGYKRFPQDPPGSYVDPFDSVDKPAHYASGDIECIDAMRAQMSTFEFQGHMKGNVVKYMWRWREKGGVESLKKARWYLNKLIESAE